MAEPDLRDLQRYVANVSIGPSTLRGQGPAGMARVAQRFLAELRLDQVASNDPAAFHAWLDGTTVRLARSFPTGGKNWGSARKALNIFLRDATCNHYLRERYRLERIEPWLEVPLDSHVAKWFKLEPEGVELGFRQLEVHVVE